MLVGGSSVKNRLLSKPEAAYETAETYQSGSWVQRGVERPRGWLVGRWRAGKLWFHSRRSLGLGSRFRIPVT